ncbi:MAG: LysM peptidoglycan-binding domain-containing protein, partial [Bacteroidia bacterium]|nr:LysM peptidoglycan-binding domain-containing protein [Bacteroidia bacterium]
NGQASSASPKSVIRPNNPFFAAQQAVQAKKAAAQHQLPQEKIHVLRAGETLYSVARDEGIKNFDEFLRINGMKKGQLNGQTTIVWASSNQVVKLQAGHKLKIPAQTEARPSPTAHETPEARASHLIKKHTTKNGLKRVDTLGKEFVDHHWQTFSCLMRW